MSAIRAFGIGAVKVCLSLAVALALTEIGLRLSGLGPSAVHTVSIREFDRVPGMYSPGQRMTVRQIRELPYELTINSLGYRGAEFPRSKPAGEFRVVVLGDSIVFGEFVDDDGTMPARLEQELRKTCSGIRVVNAGLSGTSIISQHQVAMRSLAIAPDLVLLIFSENDVSGLDGTPYWDRLADARRRKSTIPLSIIYAIARDSAIWTALMRARANIQGALGRAHADKRRAGDDRRRVEELRREYMALLQNLQNDLAQHEIRLVVSAFPSHLTLRRLTSDDKVTWFAEAARQGDLPYVDVYGWLDQQTGPRENLYQLPWDGHPSARGHAEAAARLAVALVRQAPLSARCAAPVAPTR